MRMGNTTPIFPSALRHTNIKPSLSAQTSAAWRTTPCNRPKACILVPATRGPHVADQAYERRERLLGADRGEDLFLSKQGLVHGLPQLHQRAEADRSVTVGYAVMGILPHHPLKIQGYM